MVEFTIYFSTANILYAIIMNYYKINYANIFIKRFKGTRQSR